MLNGIPVRLHTACATTGAVLGSTRIPPERLDMANPASSTFLQWARGLRFPALFMITAGVLAVDLLLPDPLPFVDEVLFGLVTLMLANWKRRKAQREVAASAPTRVVADYPRHTGNPAPGASPPPPPLPDSTHPH